MKLQSTKQIQRRAIELTAVQKSCEVTRDSAEQVSCDKKSVV